MATVTRRGCGTRVAGGVYMETDMSPWGQPVEYFLYCPPVERDWAAMGLSVESSRGVVMHQSASGIWHVYDIVGANNYPNVQDVIEEARKLGPSRRAEGIDYSLLGDGSHMILLHRKAMIGQYYRYFAYEPEDAECPKLKASHSRLTIQGETRYDQEMCARLWRQDIVDGADLYDEEGGAAAAQEAGLDEATAKRAVVRSMPWGDYNGLRRPEQITDPEYRLAAVAAFPIHRLAVIRGEAGEHETKLDKTAGAGVPVELQDA